MLVLIACQSRQYLTCSSFLGHILFKSIVLVTWGVYVKALNWGDIEGLEVGCLCKGLEPLVVMKPGFLSILNSFG